MDTETNNFAGPSAPSPRSREHQQEPAASNKVVCPECGKVRMETPPGTTVLPTLGMALKASGAAGPCGCGKTRGEMVAGAPEHEAHSQDG